LEIIKCRNIKAQLSREMTIERQKILVLHPDLPKGVATGHGARRPWEKDTFGKQPARGRHIIQKAAGDTVARVLPMQAAHLVT
jgi:hypothetical protein